MDLSLEAVVARLDQAATLHAAQDVPLPDGFRAAAVVAPLVQRADGLHLIFNKRAENLDNHPGQVSFPGGRRDPEDPDLLATATREMAEELAIAPHQHRPLKRLMARKVISSYFVTPFASLVDPAAEIIPEPGEVAYHFEVPLAWMAQINNAAMARHDIFGAPRTFYTWIYEGETIWGATGRMVADLMRDLGLPEFEP